MSSGPGSDEPSDESPDASDSEPESEEQKGPSQPPPKADSKPDAKPAPPPEPKPVAKPESKPVAKSEGKPVAPAAPKPDSEPPSGSKSAPGGVPAAPVWVRPQVEPGPVPVLWPVLLDELDKPGIDNEFLIRTLSNIHQYPAVVLKFLDIVNQKIDVRRREEVFGLFLDLISQRGRLDGLLDVPTISKVINFIVNYKVVLTSWAIVEKIPVTLNKLFGALPPPSLAAIGTVFAPIVGKYVPLGYAAYGQKQPLSLDLVINPVQTSNLAYIQALVWFFENYTYEALSADNSARLHNFKYNTIAAGLLKGDERSQLLGVKWLVSLFHFRPADFDPVAKLPFDSLISLLAGSSDPVRLSVIPLLGRVPVDSGEITANKRLPAILTHLAEHLTSPKGEYAKAVFEFIEPRKGIPSFSDCVQSLFTADNAITGAVIISVELGLFQATPEYGKLAFPSDVKTKRLLYTLDAVPYIQSKGPFTEELTEGLLGHLLLIYQSSSILKDPAQTSAAVASVKPFIQGSVGHLAFVSGTLLKSIQKIKNEEILRELADALSEVEIPPIDRPLEELFCKVFCHVYSVLWSNVDVFHLMSLFWSVTEHEDPETAVDLIKRGVPDPYRKKLLSQADADKEKSPQLAIIVAAMPGLTPKQVNDLLTKVFAAEDVITVRLVEEVLTTLSIQYLPVTLAQLERLKLGGRITTNVFIPRSKRLGEVNAISGVFTVLPKILQGPLETKNQELVWRIIAATFPKDNYEECKEAILNLHDVFPLIKDIVPTEAQYTPLLRPEFAHDFSVFLANVPPNDDLAVKIIQLWFLFSRDNPGLAKDTKYATDLVFRLSQKEELLFHAVFRVKRKRVPLTDRAIPFVTYVQAVIESAHEHNVHPEPITYIDFLLHFLNFTVCTLAELRTRSITAVSCLLNLTNAPKSSGDGLCADEVNKVAYDLYVEMARNTSDAFIDALLKHVIEIEVQPCHAFLLRAIFATRDDFLRTDRIQALLRVFNIYSSFNELGQHHLELGVLALAKRSMPEFIPVLFTGLSVFLKVVFGQILNHFEVRPIFIRDYTRYLMNQRVGVSSLIGFQYFSQVVVSEPDNEIEPDVFGYFISIIVMWIGLVAGLNEYLQLLDRRAQQSSISNVLDEIFTRSTIGHPRQVPIDMTTGAAAAETFRQIAHSLLGVLPDKLLSVIDHVVEIVSTKQAGYVLAGGVFFVQLIAALDPYETEDLSEVKVKLVDALKQTLGLGDTVAHLYIATSIHGVLPQKDLQEMLLLIYPVAVDGLHVAECYPADRYAVTFLLSSIIGEVPKEQISSQLLYEALKNSFEKLDYTEDFIKPLLVWSQFGGQIPGFLVQSKLSIEGLFTLFGSREKDLVLVLKNLVGDDIVAGLKEKEFNPRVLSIFGLTALRVARDPISVDLLNLLINIGLGVVRTNDKTVIEFKKSLIALMLKVAEGEPGDARDLAIGHLKDLIK